MTSLGAMVNGMPSGVTSKMRQFSTDITLHTLPDQSNDRSSSAAHRGVVASLLGRSVEEDHGHNNSSRSVGGGRKRESQLPSIASSAVGTEGVPLKSGRTFLSPANVFNMNKLFTPTANTEGMTQNVGSACTRIAKPIHLPFNNDVVASVGLARVIGNSHSPSDGLTTLSQDSLQLLEERIDTEVNERRRLWSTLMEGLGVSQATVKRLDKKLEDMAHMFQQTTGSSHNSEGNLGERYNALEGHVDHLKNDYGRLQMQLQTLQTSIQQRNPLQEAQLANERQNTQLHAAISDAQAQVIANDTCSALEARLKAEIVQWKCSQESLAEQIAELNARSENRFSVLEARVGTVCMKELDAQVVASDACSALEARLKAEIAQWEYSQESKAAQLAELHANSERRCADLEAHVATVCMKEIDAKVVAKDACSALESRLTAEIVQWTERRCSALEARVGSVCMPEVEVQVLANDACNALEARLKAEIVQWKCSQENLTEHFAKLHKRSEQRCANLEACVGGVCVPELVSSMGEGLQKRINTLQALMEKHYAVVKPQVGPLLPNGTSCNSYTREVSPLRNVGNSISNSNSGYRREASPLRLN